MTATPATPGAYPARFTFDAPEEIARWRPLVHWLLAIPQFIVAGILQWLAEVLAFISWVVIVLTGRQPEGLANVIAMSIRYGNRVNTYAFFLREEYPPFAFDVGAADPGDDPRVRTDFDLQLEDRNRASVFFRIFLLIPHVIVLAFVAIGAMIVLGISFFVVLFTGRWNEGMLRYVLGVTRWTTRLGAYAFLLNDEFPPFSLD